MRRIDWKIGAWLVCCTAPLAAGCARMAEPEVVVYVAVDRKDAESMLRTFESETGIRVRAVYDAEAAKTTGLVTRLLAESTHPRCDVFWNNEIVQTLLLAERGLVAAYHSPSAETIPDRWKADDGAWTAIATRARVIAYNTRHVAADQVPKRLEDLTGPAWRGKLAMADPQFGTTRTHVAALFAAWGPEAAQQFLRKLLGNQVRIVDGNAMVKNLVARAQPGASPVYVGLTDTDDVMAGKSEGQPIDMVFPDQDDGGTLVIPSAICLLRGAPHPDAARRLIDYLLSPETERRLTAAGTGYFPVRRQPGGQPALERVRAIELDYRAVLRHLEASSRWTARHFHP